ncbi:MAG TPA: hypothetical protein PLJ21_01555 [Pseudobdellovibrionaceae bacterium]|nr:hypothetical protein [Pseudobdellovibrionaceae bacterium]
MKTKLFAFFFIFLFQISTTYAKFSTEPIQQNGPVYFEDTPISLQEIRYLYPDLVIQRHIQELSAYLRTHRFGKSGTRTDEQKRNFDLLKTTSYKEEITMRGENGANLDLKIRILVTRYDQHILVHYELPRSNTIYVEIPPELLNYVDMDFLETHLMVENEGGRPKRLVSFSDVLLSYENFPESYRKLSIEKIDRMMKTAVMSLSYNRQLQNITESMIQDMFVKKLAFDSAVAAATNDVEPEMVQVLAHLRDKSIDFLREKVILIWTELKSKNPDVTIELAEKELLRQNKINNFVLPDDSLARVEITNIQDEYVIRILLHGSERVFLWMSSELARGKSTHFSQYMARQFREAGTDRTDGVRGRDVAILYYDKLQQSENSNQQSEVSQIRVEDHPRPANYSFAGIKANFKSIVKAPELKDQGFAIFCGVTQAGIMSAVNLIKMAIEPSYQFNWLTVGVIYVFGWGIGSIPSTYNNWVYRKASNIEPKWKQRSRQILKSATISSLYVMAISYVTGGASDLAELASVGAYGAVAAYVLDKMANIVTNSFMRTEVSQWAVIQREEGLDRHNHDIRIPFTNIVLWKTNISHGKWNTQIRANSINIGLRSPHLLGVPYGLEIYFGSYFLIKYLTLKWAELKHPTVSNKLRLRERWNLVNPFNIRFWKNIPTIINTPIRYVHNKISSKKIVMDVNELSKSTPKPHLILCRPLFNKAP